MMVTVHARSACRMSAACLAALAVVACTLGARPVGAQATELNGSAFGAFVKVGLFGGPPGQVGAAPAVVLPSGGGKEAAGLPELIAQFGPATVFGGRHDGEGRNPSGRLSATTEGQTGDDAFVTSSATVVDVGPGPLIAQEMSSTCRADASGVTGSTRITEGIVETSYDAETQEPATTEAISESPPPNTAVEGTIDHVSDRFRIVFNEQVVEGDTIVVRAAHMYLLGPIAVGDLIIGQSVCGLSADADGSTTPPTQAASVTSVLTTLPDELGDRGADTERAASTGTSTDDGGGGALPVAAAVVAAGGLAVLALVTTSRRRRARRPS